METFEGKETNIEEKGNICTLCAEDKLRKEAVGYCGKCGKFACDSCLRSHAKFLPEHNLITDLSKVELSARFCDVHKDQIVELYCEDHGCVFCKFCRHLKHKRCSVQTVADAIATSNVEAGFASVFERLTQMQEQMKNKRDENQAKLVEIPKQTDEVKIKLASLKRGLIEVLDSFENSIDDRENAVLETSNANMQSYSSFSQQLHTNISKFRDNEKNKMNREALFFSVIELKQLYTHYKEMLEEIEDEKNDSEIFVIQDERLPMLINCLMKISASDGPFDISLHEDVQKSMENKCCQTETASPDATDIWEKVYTVSESTKSPEGKQSNDQIDDAEQGSSEITLEHGLNNIGTKSFLSIKSWHMVTAECVSSIPSKVSMLQNSRIIYQSDSKVLNILDINMTKIIKLELFSRFNADFGRYQYISIDSMDFTPFDNKSVVIAVSGSGKKKCHSEEERFNTIQLLKLIPNISLGHEIHLRYRCKRIACFDNKIYVYTSDLGKSSSIKCPGVEIMTSKGDVLQTVQLFQDFDLSCFCANKNGDIVFFGSKCVNGNTEHFIKCISKEGDDVYLNSCSAQPKSMAVDTDGNVLVLGASGSVAVLKPDGSEVQCLLEPADVDEMWQPTSIFYNDVNNTILVGGYIEDRPYSEMNCLYLFQLQY